MSVQVSKNNTNVLFIRSGSALSENATLLQDAGRAVDLVFGTVMAKVAATQKWVPFTDETAVTGAAIPQGIYAGPDVPFANLVAGDVVDAPIYVGGSFTFDVDQLTIENSKTLATVITTGLNQLITVKDHLFNKGIFTEDVVDVTSFENA